MADHLTGKFWGLWGALIAALITLALIVPAGAEAASPGSAALGQITDLVPAPVQSAVAAALSQVPSASVPGASGASPLPAPVVTPTARPHVPIVASTPPPTVVLPTQARQLPVPAPPPVATVVSGYGRAPSAPAESVPQPDVALKALGTELSPPNPRGSRPSVGRQIPTRRHPHGRARHHSGSLASVRAASTRRAPIARAIAAFTWLPARASGATSRRGAQPAAPARRADSRVPARHARHLGSPPSRPGRAVSTPPLALPLSSALPPGGAEGSAAGAGGGAGGATAAAVLALVGLCILRALLPGLLGLGLGPVQSALLVSRLERPG